MIFNYINSIKIIIKNLASVFINFPFADTITTTKYNDDLELSYSAIEMFYAIQAHSKRRLYLEQIATNCQFMGMDGTNHTDVIDSKAKEYSFILMLCDEIIDDNLATSGT